MAIQPDSVQLSVQLHDGVAGIPSDATLVVLIADHPDVAAFSESLSPAAEKRRIQSERKISGTGIIKKTLSISDVVEFVSKKGNNQGSILKKSSGSK